MTFERVNINGQAAIKMVPPEHMEWLRAFTVLRGPWTENTDGDPREIVRRAGAFIPVPVISPVQKHGICVTEGCDALPYRPDADGVLVTGGTGGMLRYADCCPVLIAGNTPHPWVVGLHSGYAGTVLGITRHTLAQLDIRGFGVRDACAWVGPCIGKCCYFRMAGEEATARGMEALPTYRTDGERVYFNLAEAIKRQLAEHLCAENIRMLNDCTCCGGNEYYSYRKGDKDDRMAMIFWIG